MHLELTTILCLIGYVLSKTMELRLLVVKMVLSISDIQADVTPRQIQNLPSKFD